MSQVLVQIPVIGEALAYKHGPYAFGAAIGVIIGVTGIMALTVSAIRKANLSGYVRGAIGFFLVLITGLSGCTLYVININIGPSENGNVTEPIGNIQTSPEPKAGADPVSHRKPRAGVESASRPSSFATDTPIQASKGQEAASRQPMSGSRLAGDSSTGIIAVSTSQPAMTLPAPTGCVFTQSRVGNTANPDLSSYRSPPRSGWLGNGEILQLNSARKIGGCAVAAGSYEVRQVQHVGDYGRAEVRAFELQRRSP